LEQEQCDGSPAEDEADDPVEDEIDDPVEDCSDAELPPHAAEPRTPMGVAGRFAARLGAPHSAAVAGQRQPSALDAVGADNEDHIVGATQPAQLPNGPPAASNDAAVGATGEVRLALTQELEAYMSLDANIEVQASVQTLGATNASTEEDDISGPGVTRNLDGLLATMEGMPGEGLEDLRRTPGELGHNSGEVEQPPSSEGDNPRDSAAQADAPPASVTVVPDATNSMSADATAEMEPPTMVEPSVEAGTAAGAAGTADDDSEGVSDVDVACQGQSPGVASCKILEEPLPDEPWLCLPPQQRDLWEKVRPRALRREAQRLRGLRLPTAPLSRLMRLHPASQVRSQEAVEIINYSTLLLMQAVSRCVVKRNPGQLIQFEDIRKACPGIRELQFLHPFQCILDESAQVVRAPALAGAVGKAAVDTTLPRDEDVRLPRLAGQETDGAEVSGAGAQTPAPKGNDRRGRKRKDPVASAQKEAKRGPGRTAAANVDPSSRSSGPASMGIASFFKRADTVA